jgi:flavin reductase (DIM6/NTAB) family NADH-FMN oxidoreductase RutF
MWEEPLPLPRSSLDARDFRSALGCFPTGVCLVTTLGPGGIPAGLTVNSFSSASLDPPMVLWSLARTAGCAMAFRDAEYFTINVLGREDEALSTHFARSGPDKFAGFAERFTPGLGGAPVLANALANFECHSRHRYYGGDHIVIIGVVERYAWTERQPLGFYRGKYVGLS